MKFNRKKLTKKVRGYIKKDMLAAIAIVSLMVNVFFFSGVVLFSATNELDISLYEAAEKNLCVDNYEQNLLDEIDAADEPAAARANLEIACKSGDFERYFENAVQLYLNDTL